MSSVLNDAQWQLLLELAYLAGEHQLSLTKEFIEGNLLSEETDELCEMISNGFLMDGIEQDFEPNAYGRELEYLLDAVNRERLR
jgi:hypothetical protein